MEVEVIRVTKLDKGFFKGFATVKLTDGDSSLVINGFTIKTTKAGKLIGTPPQTKNEKDGKYYDLVTLEGDFMWKVSNAIVAAYEGKESQSEEVQQGNPGSKVDMAKREGAEKVISKVGKFDPWAE